MNPETPSVTPESSTPDCPVCPILRKRIHDLEEAAENYIQVIHETGELRVAAHDAMVKAMTVDFDVAILSAHDISDVDRKFWLDESAKHEATR